MHPGERLKIFVTTANSVQVENDSNQAVIAFGNSADIFNLLDGTPLVNSASVNLPESQQGYFANEVTTLGTITSSFIGTQEQFYSGELSGSDLNTGQFYLNQYNPYNRVPGNSTSSAAFQSELPVADFSVYGSSSYSSFGGIGTPTNFTATSPNSLTFDTKNGGDLTVGARFAFAASQSLIPLQNYLVTFDLNITTNDFGNPAGLSSFGMQNGVSVINGVAFGNATGQVNGINPLVLGTGYVNGTYPTTTVEGFGTGTGLTLTVVTGLSNTWTIAENGTGYKTGDRVTVLGNTTTGTDAVINITNARAVSLSSTGDFVVSHSFMAYPTPDDPIDYQSLSLQAGSSIIGSLTNFKVEGVGGEFAKQVAPIYLNPLQQDQWQILNTQSITFDNSDYNPLNNNINPQRSSSFRYALTYDQSQYQPTEFDSIVTWSYDNQSPSASRPNPATLEDSQYTQQAYILPRYKGSKLLSLDYNFFTPSGTVGPIQAQPTAPYNIGYGYSSSVANEFLDGATGSYTGDLSFGQTSCIDKNPQYIAHFQTSFSPTSYYQSMQFNIDTLIEIPMDDIGGEEITPTSIQINGNNENKKFVSSVFEPNRKLAFTFDDLTFNNIQYGTIGVGPYKILNAATVFQTLNSNARNFQDESNAYQYQQAGVPVTSSVTTPAGTIQMVTASNITTITGTPVQSNGFLLSGSNTLFTITGVGENFTLLTAGGGYTTSGVKSTTATTGNGTGLTMNITSIGGGGSYVSGFIQDGGTGYAIGDQYTIDGGSPLASFVMKDIIGETSQSVNEPLIPSQYRLEVAGPQLALYHTYNKLVENKTTRPDPFCLANSNFVPFSASDLWIKDGLDPRDTDNYYSWYPSGSNCNNYADYQQPYLINRGDVIRVEGLREVFVADSVPSQSLAFNKDFTVLDVQNYRNSGSQGSSGITVGSFVDNSAASFTAFPTVANLSSSILFDDSQFVATGAGTGGTLSLTSTSPSKFYTNITSGFFISAGSSGYEAGDVITVSSGVLNAAGFGSTFGSINITLQAANVNATATGPNNGFSLKVDSICWNGGVRTYSQQAMGALEIVTPTFIEVTPDPLIALNGLQGGAITKYTIRREVEQDDRVMIRSVQAPSGSKGTETQSGGGYIIPNDLSLQQKENAVNIINQLRAKNAFPGATPNATTQGS